MDAVIFDFDGVIADSEGAHERAIRGMFEPMGMPFDHAFFVANCIGASDSVAYRRIAALHGREMSDEQIAALRPVKEAAFTKLAHEGLVRAWPGAVELVRAAAERGPVALCSGSLGEQVSPVLERFGLLDVLRVRVTADRVRHTKPDPEGYLLAASMIGVEPARCTAIEDSPTGLRAAKAAGLRAFAVEHSYPGDALRPLLGQHDRLFATIDLIRADELVSGALASR